MEQCKRGECGNSSYRMVCNDSKNRIEWQEQHGGRWFVHDATLAHTYKLTFLSCVYFSVSRVGISSHQFRISGYGAVGSVQGYDYIGGAVRFATGGALTNGIAMSLGDGAAGGDAPTHPLSVDRDIYIHVHFALPHITSGALRKGLYYDQDNYIGFRYDPQGLLPEWSGSANWHFVTRAGGAETRTNLGVPTSGWYDTWGCMSESECVVVLNDETPITHTTNIPACGLTYHAYIENGGAVYNLDLQKLTIVQDFR